MTVTAPPPHYCSLTHTTDPPPIMMEPDSLLLHLPPQTGHNSNGATCILQRFFLPPASPPPPPPPPPPASYSCSYSLFLLLFNQQRPRSLVDSLPPNPPLFAPLGVPQATSSPAAAAGALLGVPPLVLPGTIQLPSVPVPLPDDEIPLNFRVFSHPINRV